MPPFVANILNLVTMYRLMLYFLLALLTAAIIESFLGILPYDPADISATALALVVTCWLVNKTFTKLLKTHPHPQSTFITALILTLIIGPSDPLQNIFFLVAASVFAISSKYVLAINKRHIFNPAAFGAFSASFLMQGGASWWAASSEMLLFVALGGILMLAKVKRFTLAFVFLATYLTLSLLFGVNPITTLTYSPIVFFTTVMLIEPLTSPAQAKHQIAFAALIGFFLVSFQQTLGVTYTLELALLAGNVYAYLVSPFAKKLLSAFTKPEAMTRV